MRGLGVDETLLRELAELTGGGALEDPRWPWLVGFVAFLLIPDVALRRLGPDGFARMGVWLGPPRWRRRREAAAGAEEGT